ncbi:alpha/beta fold hydrolase [Hyphococcus sp.]|uniref:alpha/beta fold hydrolase n=1 Tax=Hyphococcus sp. TaxID=2038636 RepID=UPI00207E9C4A|nr:MAG: alpha/beta hydrolase [Marinicaulis sp.]
MKKLLGGLVLLVVLFGAFGAYTYFNAAGGVSASALEKKYLSADDRFVDIDGARVRVRIEGADNAPAIILVHGFTHSLETWDGWASVLKQDHRVIRYDLMGHGLTGPDLKQRYSPAERAQTIGDIMDALGVDHAAIVGNSLGGLAAWRFASGHPDRVEKLILISPGAYPLNGAADAPAEIPAAMKVYLMTAPEAGVRASAGYIYADDSKITDARVAVMRDMMHREGNGEALIQSLEEFTLPDPTEALSRITAPTLIEWGEGDVIIPIQQGRDLAAAIPGAKLITYPGVGHAAQEEAPAETVADAIAFLRGDAPAPLEAE